MTTNENLFCDKYPEHSCYHIEDCIEDCNEGYSEVEEGTDYSVADCNGEDASLDIHPYPTSCVAFGSHEQEHCAHTFHIADDQKDLRHTG